MKLHLYLYIVKLKEHISRFVLSRYKDDKRGKKGCSLRNADSVGLLYLERDYVFYRSIKELAKQLQENFGVRRVSILSFVELDAKRTPGWLVKKLDSGYFCKSDLNWYGKPQKEIQAFIESEFDILFDLELEPNLTLKHVLKMSCAKMKVGPKQENWPYLDYDVQIGRKESQPIEGEEHIDPMIVWKEQVDRTIQFISKANIQ